MKANDDPGPAVTYFVGMDQWMLLRDWCDYAKGVWLCVPAGFMFDMASIPWFLRWHTNIYHLSIRAALFHDYLYRYRGVCPPATLQPYRTFSRRDADRIFLEQMIGQGVSRLRRVVSYVAVRLVGWWPWYVSGAEFQEGGADLSA